MDVSPCGTPLGDATWGIPHGLSPKRDPDGGSPMEIPKWENPHGPWRIRHAKFLMGNPPRSPHGGSPMGNPPWGITHGESA